MEKVTESSHGNSVPDTRVISFAQACSLKNYKLDSRVAKDLDMALIIAHHHIEGSWISYPAPERVPIERIFFVLYNDPQRLITGRPVVECKIMPSN